MNKLYLKLGLFLSIIGTSIGITGLFMRMVVANDHSFSTFLIYTLLLACGLLVLTVTLRSTRNPRMRYYSKQFQAALLYLAGSLVVAKSGDMAGVILFLLGLALAFRYSYLHGVMIFITAGYNCLMIVLYAFLHKTGFVEIIHELMFILFAYGLFFIIFTDFSQYLNLKIYRLNKELDIARGIVPFGTELKKKIEDSGIDDVEFTKKEYEVMVAICVHEKVSNDELTEFMNLSNATIKSHLNNIYRKTGIHSRSRLVSVYKDIFTDRIKEEHPIY